MVSARLLPVRALLYCAVGTGTWERAQPHSAANVTAKLLRKKASDGFYSVYWKRASRNDERTATTRGDNRSADLGGRVGSGRQEWLALARFPTGHFDSV